MTKEQEEAIEILKEIQESNRAWLFQTKEENCEKMYLRDIEAIETVLNMMQEQQAKIEKKDKELIELTNLVIRLKKETDKLRLIAGLALKGKPLEISKKTFSELKNTIEIERTENIMNDSYIFRAK